MYLMQSFLLFAATAWSLAWLGGWAKVILMVAGGLGFVIFVHELGHFVVAKLCGVKCEKFYLGFDIGGLKLFHFQYGETEYGIGILPLGGYVKMLGQDDNPAGEAADIERAKTEPLDPRSYKAQTVPERMAIISAGVIMNLIFAVVFAAIAFRLGVVAEPCIVAGTLPGEAAWQADMQPGDVIVQINDRASEKDDELRWTDLMHAVMLSNPDTGVRFRIKREGIAEPFWLTLKPERVAGRMAPMIGASGPRTTTLRVVEGLTPGILGFKVDDKISAIDGQPIADNAEFQKLLAHHPDDAVRISVERPKHAEGEKPAKDGPTETLEISVPPRPLQTLGLVMKMGPITAIQENSVAAAAGLRAGDQIVSIDGQPVGDPITLPERIRRMAGNPVEFTIERKGEDGKVKQVTQTITPRTPDWSEVSSAPNSPQAVTALGIAYSVLNEIDSVEPGSPADKAELSGKGSEPNKLTAGMKIARVELLAPPKKDKDADEPPAAKQEPAEFGPKGIGWPYFHAELQQLKPGTKVKFTLADDRTVELEPVEWAGWNDPDREFVFTAPQIVLKADSVGKALPMGARETRDSVMQVYGFLRRIGTRISPMGLGGPITIAAEAGHEAGRGLSELLIFLTMLSANLAVINFLPIPILDGGHMVFLLAEAVMRKPVSERVQLGFTYVGLAFILSLMIFVFGLDLGRLFSWI